MEFNNISCTMKYRISCADNHPQNCKASHSGGVSPRDRGTGFYWIEGKSVPSEVRAEYIEPIAERFKAHGHLESIMPVVDCVPHIPGAEAVMVDITAYLKGGSNGSPRLQVSFHVFKEWDKAGKVVG